MMLEIQMQNDECMIMIIIFTIKNISNHFARANVRLHI